jgi:hypothetical protein
MNIQKELFNTLFVLGWSLRPIIHFDCSDLTMLIDQVKRVLRMLESINDL